MAEVAMYRALRRGQVNGNIIPAGQVFPFEGRPGRWMEPTNGPAEKAKKEAEKRFKDPDEDFEPIPTPPPLGPEPPRRVMSHPDLPNPEGSSGEEEGDEVPFAAARRRERELAADQSDATRSARAGKRRGGAKGRKGKVKRVAAKRGDTKPPRPQSDPLAPADDAGTTS